MLEHRFTDLATHTHWVARAADVLPVDELERAQHFRRPVDRERYLAAHVGLRLMLADVLGIPSADLTVSRSPCTRCGGPHGRPELAPSTGLFFSLSRSQQFAAFVVADEPVGIDIESLDSISGDAEMRSSLHPAEWSAVNRLPIHRRPPAIIRCWVRKEAALKATGIGLNLDPASILVGASGDPTAGVRVADRSIRWIGDLDAPPGYVSAAAIAAA
jgi:4'-phosphopantetheinyl transferase